MRLKLIKGVLLFSVILSIFGIYKLNQHHMSGLTMRQAYLKAYASAAKVNKKIMLYSLTSVDIENKKDSFNGENGKRNNWNLDFAIPETNEHYIVQIQDGDIINTTEVTGVKYNRENLISYEEILLDSKEALEIAKKQYQIVPGNEWAIGFHFTIKKENGISKQTIVAYDKDRNLCKINFDMQDKTVISAQHKVDVGGGLYDSNGTDLLKNQKMLSKIAQGKQNNVLVIAGYEIKNDIEYDPILLFKSSMNDWKKYKTIDDILDIKIFNDNILIICKNKVELLNIKTEIATSLLEENIISARQNKNSEIFITDKDIFVYNLSKLETIMQIDKNKITENSFALIDNNDKCYLCTDRTIYLVKNNELKELITMDEPIVDALVDCRKAYIITQNKVFVYDINLKEMVFEKENSEDIVRLIKPEINVVLAINGVDNSFFTFKKVGDVWEIKKKNTLDKEFGILMDISGEKADDLIYAFEANATWMDMPSERSNK